MRLLHSIACGGSVAAVGTNVAGDGFSISSFIPIQCAPSGSGTTLARS